MATTGHSVTILTSTGDVVPNAPIEIRLYSTGLLANIFEQNGTPITQLGATADANGIFRFWAEPNEYFARNGGVDVPVTVGVDEASLINDLSRYHSFDTVSEMTASTIVFPTGKEIKTKGYYVRGDGGDASYIVETSASNVIPKADHTLSDGSIAKIVIDETVGIRQLGAVSDGDWVAKTGTDSSLSFDAISLIAEEKGAVNVVIDGTYLGVLFVNKSNVTISGSGVIFSTASTMRYGVTLSVEPTDVGNLAPFMGQPWNYQGDISSSAKVWRCAWGGYGGKQVGTYSGNVVDTTPVSSAINIGDTCILIKGSHTISTASTNHVPQKFQFLKAEDVTGTVVTFDEELYTEFSDSGDPDEAAYLVHWPTMLQGISITGITIRNEYTNGVYLHRISGIWDGVIDVKTHAETGGGAIATCKRLSYNVNCQRGYNGISTARMSEDIRINAVVKVGRVQEGGNDQGLGCFIEENPRKITFENLVVRGGSLNFYGASEHTNINGLVDISGFDNTAMIMSTIESDAVIDLHGRLDSDHADGTVQSTFLSACNVHFAGDINNSSTGAAWNHNTGTSNVLPRCKISSNTAFGAVNYYNSIRKDIDTNRKLSSDDFSASGYITAAVSGGVITEGLKSGRISGTTRDSLGIYSVSFTVAYAQPEDYVVTVSGRVALAEVWQKYNGKLEVRFTDHSGSPIDPSSFDVVIFDKG